MPENINQKTEVTIPDRIAQRDMHKNFFDRCQLAIDNGFYMEAILMEYAAIEARLEVILGMLGLPCNQFLDHKDRKDICISHRIACLKKIKRASMTFEKSKLPKKYFETLEKWIRTRNGYIHGLYKSEVQYKTRMKDSKETAEKGFELCRLLYNEANRIRRMIKKQNWDDSTGILCYSDKCKLYPKKNEISEV